MMDVDMELPIEAEDQISDQDAQRPRMVSIEDVTDNDEDADADWVYNFPEQSYAGAAGRSS